MKVFPVITRHCPNSPFFSSVLNILVIVLASAKPLHPQIPTSGAPHL